MTAAAPLPPCRSDWVIRLFQPAPVLSGRYLWTGRTVCRSIRCWWCSGLSRPSLSRQASDAGSMGGSDVVRLVSWSVLSVFLPFVLRSDKLHRWIPRHPARGDSGESPNATEEWHCRKRQPNGSRLTLALQNLMWPQWSQTIRGESYLRAVGRDMTWKWYLALDKDVDNQGAEKESLTTLSRQAVRLFTPYSCCKWDMCYLAEESRAIRRRATPNALTRPVPSSVNEAGSGVGAGDDVDNELSNTSVLTPIRLCRDTRPNRTRKPCHHHLQPAGQIAQFAGGSIRTCWHACEYVRLGAQSREGDQRIHRETMYTASSTPGAATLRFVIAGLQWRSR